MLFFRDLPMLEEETHMNLKHTIITPNAQCIIMLLPSK
jgi:hypothetical protein